MDIRSEDNEVLLAIDRRLREIAAEIGARRGVTIDLGAFTNAKPGPIDRAHAATGAAGEAARHRGAADGQWGGHDAAVFGIMGVPTAMIFIRNEHGSHNPDEAMDLADFAQGLRLLVAAVEEIDAA